MDGSGSGSGGGSDSTLDELRARLQSVRKAQSPLGAAGSGLADGTERLMTRGSHFVDDAISSLYAGHRTYDSYGQEVLDESGDPVIDRDDTLTHRTAERLRDTRDQFRDTASYLREAAGQRLTAAELAARRRFTRSSGQPESTGWEVTRNPQNPMHLREQAARDAEAAAAAAATSPSGRRGSGSSGEGSDQSAGTMAAMAYSSLGPLRLSNASTPSSSSSEDLAAMARLNLGGGNPMTSPSMSGALPPSRPGSPSSAARAAGR